MLSWVWASYAFGHSLSNALVTQSIVFCPKTTDSSFVCMCVCARLAAATQNLRFCFVFLLLLLSLSACWAVRLSASFLATKISCAIYDETRSQRNFQSECCCCCYCLLFITVTAVGRLLLMSLSQPSSCPTLSVSFCLSFLVFSSQRVGGFLFVQKLVASGKDTTWTWNRFPHFFTHIYIRVCVYKYLEQALLIRFVVALSFVIVFKKLCC